MSDGSVKFRDNVQDSINLIIDTLSFIGRERQQLYSIIIILMRRFGIKSFIVNVNDIIDSQKFFIISRPVDGGESGELEIVLSTVEEGAENVSKEG